MEKYYAAYGSNMKESRMLERCPGAVLVGTGTLPGYRLSFRRSSSGYYTSLDRAEGENVPVVLWRFSEADERSLDGYEGYPTCYGKFSLPVQPGPDCGLTGPVEAVVYILPESRRLGAPPVWYQKILFAAYEKFGFDLDKLKLALQECGA